MIKSIKINNIAVIAGLDLDFEPGLSLLTGETGAGKSILIDALGLLLGNRASSDLIRTGETTATVEAIIEIREIRPFLEAHGLPADDDEVVIRREVHASGRTRASINGALAPIALLKDMASRVAAIHGQHEPQGLLDPSTHLALVDQHGDLNDRATELVARFRRYCEAETALERLRRDRREVERRRETLEYQAGEIEKAELKPGEEEDLKQEKIIQANAGRLLGLSQEAYALLYEDEGSVLAHLGQVYRRIEELSELDPRFVPFVEARTAVGAQLEDLAFFLRDYSNAIVVSPGRLDEIELRLALIDRLKRKYGATVEEVLVFARACREDLASLGTPEEQERALETRCSVMGAAYLDSARALSGRRRTAAKDLERKVEAELKELAMGKTHFRVRFDPESVQEDRDRWSESGLERIEFQLSPNPGEDLRPLARIASGGELSRILLALKSVANVDGTGKTLVFDEVDAGIGGAVAEVVGRKLRAISAQHQVLCVTHLPQIAAQADHHFVVRKRVERGRTITDVARLSPEERIEEVARMLGGESVTEAARRHAREMIATATAHGL